MGRGLLTMAGMVSGGGQALEKGLGTVQAGLVQSSLQEERDKLDRARMAIMEQYATNREQRGYAHQEAMQGQSFANQDKMQQRGFAHAEALQETNQDFTSGENDLTRQHDLKKQGKAQEYEGVQKDLDRKQAKAIADATVASHEHEGAENRTTQEKIAGGQLEEQKSYHQQAYGVSLAQLQAHKDETTLLPQADGTFVKVTRDGRILGTAMDPETKQPLKGGKDLPAATKILTEVNLTMIKGKMKELESQTLLPEERAKIQGDVDKLKQETEAMLGKTAPAKAQIVDPDAPREEMTDAQAAQADREGADETTAQLKRESRKPGLINQGYDQRIERRLKEAPFEKFQQWLNTPRQPSTPYNSLPNANLQ